MQGRHFYQPELFSSVNVDRLIPRGHLLRRIDRVLDLEFLYALTAPLYSQSRGRPSIDPEMFVRMILSQALYNVDSDRQVCEEIGFNLAYRWFCRLSMSDDVPDHSSMSKIRDRLGEATYRKIFEEVINQCRKAGLVKGKRVLADGSYISANASIYSMKPKVTTTEDPPAKPGGGIGVTPSKDGFSNNDLKRDSIAGRKLSNETHFSPSDPDSSLAGKHSEYKSLRYKTHHIADADSRVILDCHVTSGNVSETTVFTDRLEETEKLIGIEIKEAIADRGYGAGDNLEYLQNQMNIQTNIPLWNTRIGQSFFKEKDFDFNSEKLAMHCPAGHQMKKLKGDKDSHVFQMPSSVCTLCPLRETCFSATQLKEKGRGKKIRVSIYHEIYKKVLEQEKLPEFKTKLKERMWKMEGLFAEGKAHHGLRRARYRRRWKVQIQVYTIATVQNLKRLAGSTADDLKSFLSKLFKIEIEVQKLKIFAVFA